VKRVHDSFNIPVKAAGGPVAASETSRSVAAPHTVPPSTRDAAAASPHPLLARALSAVEEEAVKACGHPLLRERAHVDDVTINAFLEVVEKTHCLSPNVQPPTGCGQIENSGQPPMDHVQVERSGQSPTCDGRAEPPTQPGECACPGHRVWFGSGFCRSLQEVLRTHAVFVLFCLNSREAASFPSPCNMHVHSIPGSTPNYCAWCGVAVLPDVCSLHSLEAAMFPMMHNMHRH
jgi:hypothetical protein